MQGQAQHPEERSQFLRTLPVALALLFSTGIGDQAAQQVKADLYPPYFLVAKEIFQCNLERYVIGADIITALHFM